MLELVIAKNNKEDKKVWNSFILTNQVLEHFYRFEWMEVLSATFNHKPYYLIVKDSKTKEIEGVLPLFYIKSFLFGSALISVPYLNGGGVVYKTKRALDFLIKESSKLGDSLGVNYLELRLKDVNYESTKEIDFIKRSHKVSMRLDLEKSVDEQFKKFPAKLRSQIRRPKKSGASVKVYSYKEIEGVRDFYKVFSKNMRDLGTPVYPYSLFLNALKSFKKDLKVVVVYLDSKPLASGIIIGNGDYIEIPWASSLREYNKISPNMLLYWQVIKTSIEGGYKVFDFGRSTKGSGTFRFKKQWGAKEEKLNWHYLIKKGKVPDVNPNSKKFSILVNSWKRLPLCLSNTLGPYITKSLP